MIEFETAVQALCDAGVEFIIIGGVSAILHGGTRVTFDLDICFSRSRSNVNRLTAALAPFHPRPRGFPEGLPFLWDEATLHNATVLTLMTDIGEIDLLAEVAGVGSYQEAKDCSILMDAYDRQVATLDLKGLIRAKRASGREKDLADLRELEGLLEARES